MRTAVIEGAGPKPLGAPDDWDPAVNGHCAGLFIRREKIDGVMFMRSAWEMEPCEATLMLAGAKQILGISGHIHPVVHMEITQLPEFFEPVMTARRITAPDGQVFVEVDMLFCADGGHRIRKVTHVDGTFADAVSMSITAIEQLARENGWLPA